jgi:hypothetical protein
MTIYIVEKWYKYDRIALVLPCLPKKLGEKVKF